MSYSEQTNEWIEKRKQYIVRGVSNGNLAIAKEAKGATKSNVIRFLAPLVITEEELEKGLAILDRAFEEAAK